MADLFSSNDLAAYLQRPVDTTSYTTAQRIASGWLSAATGLTTWPDPVPDDLWAWAVELAALAYSNPEGLAVETEGSTTATWERARRDAILAAARVRYGQTGAPRYGFDCPAASPDPIIVGPQPECT